MEYYRLEVLGQSDVLESLSPNEVFRLLVTVLSMESTEQHHEKKLTPRQIRFIDGCLGRTPANFYEKVTIK